MTIISKKELTQRVAKNTRISQTQVETVLTELLEQTKKALIKGEEIRLVGYFSLSTHQQPAREMTMRFGKDKGKKKKIPAKTVPTFKFSSALKKRVVK